MPKLAADVAALTRLGPFMRRCQRRYGDLVSVRLHGFGTVVGVGDPALVKRVFTASPTTLHSGEGSPLGPILGPNSLLVIDRDHHLRQRKLLLPPFHGGRMQAYEPLIERITREEVAAWPEGEPFAVAPTTLRITLRVILQAVFGASGEQLRRLEELMPRFASLGSALTPFPQLHHDLGRWSPWGRFKRMRAEVDAICDTLIAQARRDPHLAERPDVLALLVQATHEDGSPMSNAEIRDQLMTMLAAGHETTAAQLAWAVERLRREPAALARLVAEVDEGGRAWRDATIREVQRVRPVIQFSSRLVKEPFELGGYLLPPGVRIVLPAALTHYDARFFPDPARFDPQRFLDRKPDTYAWIPFGGGVRRCIGAAFAHMEMDVVLRTVLERWELLPAGPDERPERMRFRGVAYAPSKGGVAVVRRRPAPVDAGAPAERTAAIAVG
jgi:cytochrome P450